MVSPEPAHLTILAINFAKVFDSDSRHRSEERRTGRDADLASRPA